LAFCNYGGQPRYSPNGLRTYYAKHTEEQVEEVEVQRKRAEDSLIDRQPLHNLLGIVEHEAREKEDSKTGDGEVNVGVEWEEDLDEGGGEEAHDSGEEERAE
jgi:hypothetical protein